MDGGNDAGAIGLGPGARAIRVEFEQLAINGRIGRPLDDDPAAQPLDQAVHPPAGRQVEIAHADHRRPDVAIIIVRGGGRRRDQRSSGQDGRHGENKRSGHHATSFR